MVVALIALFVALGGAAVAAIKLPRSSVGTAQLVNGAVTGSKLGNAAVTSVKVRDHSLLAKDFRVGQLSSGAQHSYHYRVSGTCRAARERARLRRGWRTGARGVGFDQERCPSRARRRQRDERSRPRSDWAARPCLPRSQSSPRAAS
jgi:hypothetical protein